MPTYQYECKQCGHKLEELQSFSEDLLLRCPNCKTDNLVRVLGGGAGLIFKGTGFYLTDYKKGSEKVETKGKKREEKASEAKEAPSTSPIESKSTDKKTSSEGSSPSKKE